jgi:hypothetical protein
MTVTAQNTWFGKRLVPFFFGALALQCLLALQAFPQDHAAKSRALPIAPSEAIKADFDRLLARRVIRVAAPYSRTLYFNDRGHERGN